MYKLYLYNGCMEVVTMYNLVTAENGGAKKGSEMPQYSNNEYTNDEFE